LAANKVQGIGAAEAGQSHLDFVCEMLATGFRCGGQIRSFERARLEPCRLRGQFCRLSPL